MFIYIWVRKHSLRSLIHRLVLFYINGSPDGLKPHVLFALVKFKFWQIASVIEACALVPLHLLFTSSPNHLMEH